VLLLFIKNVSVMPGQFLFTFVGNFNTDSIKPLIEKYVASLPGTPQKENYKDVGYPLPCWPDQQSDTQRQREQSQCAFVFTGATNYNETDDQQLSQLCKALGIKLREVLSGRCGWRIWCRC
jgi:zinc protease